MKLSAEVIEGEEGVREHQVLGASGGRDEKVSRGVSPSPQRQASCEPNHPVPSNGIPSWRPQGAEPVATAAAHQCRARRGPRPAEPHPCSPAVRTGDREWRLRQIHS